MVLDRFRAMLSKHHPQYLCGAHVQDEKLYEGGILSEEAALRKAAAWYYVTYSKDEEVETYNVGNVSVRFLSFPWIVSDYLMKIYSRNLFRGRVSRCSVQREVGQSICMHFRSLDRYIVNVFKGSCRVW